MPYPEFVAAIGVMEVKVYFVIPLWKWYRLRIASKTASEENPHVVRERFEIAKPLGEVNGGNNLVLKSLRVSMSEGKSWVCETTYNLLSHVPQEYPLLDRSGGHSLKLLIGPKHPL
jgi:hypothetical protein